MELSNKLSAYMIKFHIQIYYFCKFLRLIKTSKVTEVENFFLTVFSLIAHVMRQNQNSAPLNVVFNEHFHS